MSDIFACPSVVIDVPIDRWTGSFISMLVDMVVTIAADVITLDFVMTGSCIADAEGNIGFDVSADVNVIFLTAMTTALAFVTLPSKEVAAFFVTAFSS